MNRFSLAAVSAALALGNVASAQGVGNRLQLDNGSDVLWTIQLPFVGAPIANGGFDPTGDLYWKTFPADALQRCSGSTSMLGIEALMFDTNFATEALWTYSISAGTTGTDQTIVPTFSFANGGVIVPGTSTTGTIFGSPGGTPGPGYVSGWTYSETFLDSLGNPTPLIDLTTDGTVDWVFTHFFPGPGFANMNTDTTLQWGGSADGFPTPLSTDGENMPDWTTLGNSVYSGFAVGGGGTFAPIPQGNDGGAQVAWYFSEPTMSVRADAGDGFGAETGVIALETPLQISSSGANAGGTTTIGLRYFDQQASTGGTDFMLAAVNVSPPFIDTVGCLPFGNSGAQLALSVLPGSGFNESFAAFSLTSPWTLDGNGEVVNDSIQVPAGTSAVWVDLEIAWQAWTFSALPGDIVRGSQIFRNTMRPNDGL